jgi:phosphate transport system substrate-binding protein
VSARLLVVGAVAFALVATGCGGGGATPVLVDGSSTLGPFTTKAAEDWKRDGGGDVTVGISGTGGGFERFCRGETDISNASRRIKPEEADLCAENGVEYVELQVVIDALTNVVSRENDWIDCITVEQLRAIWSPGSKITSWKQVDPTFPDVKLLLFGPGTDSGTFDYFTEAINGEAGASRSDYSATEDDNVTVQGVAGNRGGLGYFGFSYYEQNEDTLRALAVDAGNGCVEPSVVTAQDGSYAPLARPLFMYVKRSSLRENDDVKAFVRYALENARVIAEEALFVPMTQEQVDRELAKLDAAVGAIG